MLLVKAAEADIPEWRARFAAVAPGLPVRGWREPGLDPAEARYALVWEPPAGWLASLPNLRAVFSLGAGVDHVTRDPAWPRHLPLVRMGGEEPAQRMGEYVAWACLTLLRDGRRMALAQAERRWDYFSPEATASERRVGLMGLGNLALAAVPMLRGLGFPVSGWSRSPKVVEGVRTHSGPEGLGAFLAETSLLVCLLPATPETEGLVDARLLARLPRGAGVVNAGRGNLLVLPDLIDALDDGTIGGAVLDVFEVEPLPSDHRAWSHPRITVTAHLASVAGRAARARYVAEAIAGFERGAPLPNLYDPSRGY